MQSAIDTDELRHICPGRFTKVSLQTRAGEVEVRLSEGGNWDLRVRADGEAAWRLACSGDLDCGAIAHAQAGPAPGEGVQKVGPIEIDPHARMAWVEGSAVPLSKKEFALLLVLASAPDRVFCKAELARAVWGEPNLFQSRTLDSHASRLRRKLRAAGAEGMVINAWAVGYRLWDRSEAAPLTSGEGRAVDAVLLPA